MLLQIVSDLHIEYLPENTDLLSLIKPVGDILILSGDIGSIYKIDQLKNFFLQLSPHFKVILYILGNHEFYYYNDKIQLDMETLYTQVNNMAKSIQNLKILDRASVVIGDTCICGSTLWSKPEIKIPKYILRIKGINNEIYENMHYKDLEYIETMIEYCQIKNLKLIVVTHYPPSARVLGNTIKKNPSLYVNNLDHLLVKEKIHTWISGHIHVNFDITTEEGTRLIGNQLGKPRENVTTFKKDFFIEI